MCVHGSTGRVTVSRVNTKPENRARYNFNKIMTNNFDLGELFRV